MHAAHRLAHDQLGVTNAEVFREQPILRNDLVLVGVFRKQRPHSIGGFRRFPSAEGIRNDDEILLRIERLPGSEKFPRKILAEHRLARPARSVQHEHRLAGGRADGDVMQLQFGQDFAGVESEIL